MVLLLYPVTADVGDTVTTCTRTRTLLIGSDIMPSHRGIISSLYLGVFFWTLVLPVLTLSIASGTSSFSSVYRPTCPGLSQEKILDLARKRYNSVEDAGNGNKRMYPMIDKVAVVTGAAGGIGSELTHAIHGLGGTVLALDRNTKGLENLVQKIATNQQSSPGRIIPLEIHQDDLGSVAATAQEIKNRFGEIDLLINNAGLTYSKESIYAGKQSMISAHGKDLLFTVNYLSHFLLTEKLLPELTKAKDGRAVHVTSTYHWKVDGSELLPVNNDGGYSMSIPTAYEADPSRQGPRHIERSYANSKLAQIWHSRMINRDRCTSVCACPTWAATGIAGEGGRDFLQKYAFAVNNCGPGMTSIINAVLRTNKELEDALNDGKSFVANSRILEYFGGRETWLTSDLVTRKLGWRDALADSIGLVLLLGQRYTYDEFIIQKVSPDSYKHNWKLEEFYKWSLQEVEPWL